jgi:hypothetical protein
MAKVRGGVSQAGRAYVFSGATTGQSNVVLHTLTSPNAEVNGFFGFSVAAASVPGVPDFPLLLIGAPQENPGGSPVNCGRAYTFNGLSGALRATLVSPNQLTNGAFGQAVSVTRYSAGTIEPFPVGLAIVGAPNESGGHVYSWTSDVTGTSNSPDQSISPPSGNNHQFGSALAANDALILVGDRIGYASGQPAGSGLVHAYHANGDLLETDFSINAELNGGFGAAVGIIFQDSIFALVGAPFESPGASQDRAGRAYRLTLFSGGDQEACCLPDGNCTLAVPDDCKAAMQGTPQGPGSTCETVNCPQPPPILINEIRIDQPSYSRKKNLADPDEFFELAGPPGASLNGLWYIVIGDGPQTLVGGQLRGGSGVVEEAIDLSGRTIPQSGFFLVAGPDYSPVGGEDPNWRRALNFENNDNVTHLLVKGFTGVLGQDLDFNDDGTLDLQPWTSIEDSVAIVEYEDPNWYGDKVYSATRVGPKIVGDRKYAPGHVYRGTDGGGVWQMGQFAYNAVGNDTPGAGNNPPTGACCIGSACTPSLTKASCEIGGGVWAGQGTSCSPNICVGACCTAGGSCSLQTRQTCVSQGRFFRGYGTTCATAGCPAPRPKLNEIWAGDPVVDDYEFLELYLPLPLAAADTRVAQSLGGMSLIVVDGDTGGSTAGSNYKRVTFQMDFGESDTINHQGHVLIGSGCLPALAARATERGCTPPTLTFPLGSFQNHSQTYALVRTQDIAYCFDPANPTLAPGGCQGMVDSHRLTDASVAAITANLIDSVATTDTDAGDHVYFNAPLVKDGIHQALQLQRITDGGGVGSEDTDTPADWDVQWNVELGDPGDSSSAGGSNCANTLGGDYQGNGSTCSPDPCRGACCVGTSCMANQTVASCASAGGAFMGLGVACPTSYGTICTTRSIIQAEALPLGSSVVISSLVVISKDDVISSTKTKNFNVRRGAAGMSIVGINSVIDPILAKINTGDTITMAGTTREYLGNFELVNDVTPLSLMTTSATALGPATVTLTAADMQNGATAAEDNEGRLVRLNCMSITNDGTGVFKADHSYTATDPTGMYFVSVRVPSTSNLVGTAIPSGARDLRGILWQADHVDLPPAVMDKGYRLIMRNTTDLLGTSTCTGLTLGACCAPAGTCACGQMTVESCTAAGGTFIGGACSPSTLCDTIRTKGDIDLDGDVDMIDMELFVLAILGKPQSTAQLVRSDLNCSGAANGGDIRVMADVLTP